MLRDFASSLRFIASFEEANRIGPQIIKDSFNQVTYEKGHESCVKGHVARVKGHETVPQHPQTTMFLRGRCVCLGTVNKLV
jgi:hypothetical protein